MNPGSTTEDTAASAPARVRPSRVRAHLPAALGALAVSLVITAVTWIAFGQFYDSLAVGDTAKRIWLAVMVALGLAAAASVVVPGVRAVVKSLAARRAERAGALQEARIASQDVKDAMWYVAGLGITSLIVAFFAYFLATNDAAIRDQYLNWDAIEQALPGIRAGFWLNIKVFVAAEVLVLIWGLILALARIFPGRPGAPVRFLAVAYIDLFRGFPAIIVIYLVVIGVQAADLVPFTWLSRPDQLFWLSVLAITLVYGAYVAEVYRSGLESIHWSQTAAARSLGLGYGQTLQHVVVPQAVRRIIPPLLNDFIGLQKDTALLSVVGVLEVLGRARLVSNRVFNLSPIVGAGLAFVLVTIPLARFTDWLVRRDQARMRAGGA